MTNACLLISLFDFLSPLCVGKTETWLNNNIIDGEVFLPGYSIHRSDRADDVASIIAHFRVALNLSFKVRPQPFQ